MSALLFKDSEFDPSKKAGKVLDYVLDDTSEEVTKEKEDASLVTEELQHSPVAETMSSREKSRVLFITRDISVLRENSPSQLHFKNIKDAFAEIHVIVLASVYEAKEGIIRLDSNVWIYATSMKHFWMQPFGAGTIARTQLLFGEGFRADIVVALDPFESGVAGLWIARKYDREFQVHVLEDFLTPEFKRKELHNNWRVKMALYVLKRAQSVRTSTVSLKEKMQKLLKHITDLNLLPHSYDIRSLTQFAKTTPQEDMFPQFSFVVLFVGSLEYESTLFRAIDAARSILFSKSIGLVVVGEGPAKKEFQKRAEILGVQEQIIFKNDLSLLNSYMRSADILLCTDSTEASDEIVVKAAVLGLPILAAQTPLRTDLFEDGTDAFLCPKEDTVCFSQKLVKFLNTNSFRVEFAQNAMDIVTARLSEDPEVYVQAYKNSIEGVFEHIA